ncbi:PAS modulated sigma54 specific transcriptional regulator, Fis family [Clostridium scatologenes]|uniref:PAS modulated sigma54 specific transcriptional regulator, Fis family n=1 Tax=Clostridium scatologenes TaxID=1548 RepID=A0A0E3M7W2_CLOSL|nr:PAS modulated sigma54 specific transcriptional regulator, Fis family [Clostridium scatologenes]
MSLTLYIISDILINFTYHLYSTLIIGIYSTHYNENFYCNFLYKNNTYLNYKFSKCYF